MDQKIEQDVQVTDTSVSVKGYKEEYELGESVLAENDYNGPEPTEEDYKNLREVTDAIPYSAYLIILIEFCERFTYYGLSGPFQNYIQYPDPVDCTFLLSSFMSERVMKCLTQITL